MANISLEERHTPAEYVKLAAELESDWLELKHELVMRRKSLATPEELAQFLGVAEDKIRYFERYDYDPTWSELRSYAMALGVRIQPHLHSMEA